MCCCFKLIVQAQGATGKGGGNECQSILPDSTTPGRTMLLSCSQFPLQWLGAICMESLKKNTTQYDFRAACQPNQVLSSAEWQETDIGNWNGGCPHTSDGNDETITQQEARQAYKGIRALGIGTVPPCNAQMLAEAQLAAEFLYVPKPQTVVHHSAHIVLSTQMDGLEYNKKIRRWFRGWKLGKE